MSDVFNARLRILGLCSPGPRLITAVARGGGFGFLNLAGMTAAQLSASAARLRVRFGVRIPASCDLPPEVIRDCGASVALLGIGASFSGLPVLAEVYSLRQAAEAVESGAAGLVAMPAELSSFVLLQQLLDEYGDEIPVWATGVGPCTTAGAVAGGAAGVLLDEQLSLFPEAGVSAVDRRALAQSDSSLAPLFARRYRNAEAAVRSLIAAARELPSSSPVELGAALCRTVRHAGQRSADRARPDDQGE